MNYLKIAGLVATATTALMVLAATASATDFTAPTNTIYTGTITAESEGETTLSGSFVTVGCKKSHIEGRVEQHGPGVTVKGLVSTLSFSECNFPTTVNKAGSLEIHPNSTGIEVTGTVTSTGAEITISTSVGQCIFTTNSSHIGTFTGSNDTGQTATVDINSTSIPRTGGSAGFLCGSSGTWNGSYKITTPDFLWLDS